MKQCNVQVRSVSARALGAMVRGMGESSFEDLLPWLMQTLTSESSSVDRSGAAQGISEVVGGLGVEKLRKLMPGEWLLVKLFRLQTRNKYWKSSLPFHYFKPNNTFLSIYSIGRSHTKAHQLQGLIANPSEGKAYYTLGYNQSSR